MNDAEMRQVVLGRVPADVDRLIVIYPSADGRALFGYFGMRPDKLAEMLYSVADEIVAKLVEARPPIPLRDKS